MRFQDEFGFNEPIVQEFCKSHRATCSFTYKGSLDIGLDLQGKSGVAEDAVWPASSVWIDMFDGARRVSHATSIAQMPVIILKDADEKHAVPVWISTSGTFTVTIPSW